MAATEKVKIHNAIEVFYLQNTSEDKKCQTYPHFNDFKVNDRPIYTKGTIYQLMRIKKCIKEIDMDMVIKMFSNLKPKIPQAMENGLDNLL